MHWKVRRDGRWAWNAWARSSVLYNLSNSVWTQYDGCCRKMPFAAKCRVQNFLFFFKMFLHTAPQQYQDLWFCDQSFLQVKISGECTTHQGVNRTQKRKSKHFSKHVPCFVSYVPCFKTKEKTKEKRMKTKTNFNKTKKWVFRKI